MKLSITALKPRPAVLIGVEHMLMLAAVVLTAQVRVPEANAALTVSGIWWRASVTAAVVQVCLHYFDLYELRSLSDRRDLFIRLLRALGAASVLLAAAYYWFPALIIARGVFVIASIFIIALVVGWRLAFEWLTGRLGPSERLLIVGTSGAAIDLARELFDRRQELGVELVGFVDPDPARVGTSLINPGIIGTVADIPSIVRTRNVDRVVVSLADARGKLSMDQLLAMKLNHGVRFDHLASVYEAYTGKIAVENLRPSWLIFSEGFRKSRASAATKRALDVVFSILGLLLTLPVLGLVAMFIKLTSTGPVLYHQERVGKDRRVFVIHKFRSMRADAEERTGAVWASQGDPRVTPIGRFLRRSRIDEIPQLWNVLKGDMSVVGPRPERPEFVKDLTEQIPFYGQRHVVKPGVTGWAQVRHTYGASVGDALQKLQFDLFYIKNMSTAFDLFVCLETVKTVIVRRGS